MRDGNIYTSAGSSAGMDLILTRVEEDFGRRVALAVAQNLVLFVKRPGGQAQVSTQIGLQRMHGAAARVPPSATAFAHRHDQWDLLILAQWPDAAGDEKGIRWARELHDAVQPFCERSVYVNDLGEGEGAERVRNAYGENYNRLVAIKTKYDPDNFFRWNQNVRPQTAAPTTRT